MSTEKKGYNFEEAVNNEESTKVQAAAVTRAKQKMEKNNLNVTLVRYRIAWNKQNVIRKKLNVLVDMLLKRKTF